MSSSLTKRIASNGVSIKPKTVTLKTRSGQAKGSVTLIRSTTEHPIAGRASANAATHRGRCWGVSEDGRTYTSGLGRGWTDIHVDAMPQPVRDALGI